MDERDRIHRPTEALFLTKSAVSRAPGASERRSASAGTTTAAAGFPLAYLANLSAPRKVLWCYLIWYLSVLVQHFDPSPGLWLSSLGIAGIIGTGLYLSTAHGGKQRTVLEPWQVVRLYLMPFCVSSFAALIKDRGFWLVLHPSLSANAAAGGACLLFLGAAEGARRLAPASS